jgi:glutaconyl-CoA/methylmalonyl-CoA decarboxylase subunit gamma
MTTRKFRIRMEGKVFEAEVEEIGAEQAAPSASKQQAAPRSAPVELAAVPTSSGNAIVAPMPCKVLAIKVTKGQQINIGDVVIILEAMKMEQEIRSSLCGTIAEILVAAGDTVRKEQLLITVE